MSRRVLRRAARAGALAGLLAVLATPAAAAPLPLLTHQGRWLTDPQGRVVTLHGLQIDRFMPGTVVEGWTDVPSSGTRFIAAQGFDLARVSIAFAGLEPQINRYDNGYLRRFVDFDRRLAAAGVYDLVDLMQGQYGTAVGGGGMPDWMTITDGVPNIRRPFPQGYLLNPAEDRAWDNFWINRPAADGLGLQDHYAAMLQLLAGAFGAQPAFLGLDLMNEPWPGTNFPTCANPLGCPLFDGTLAAFYHRVIPQLRAAEPHHLVFYEPHALFDEGAASTIGSVADANAVFTFHNYCLGDQPGLPQADPGQDCGVEEQLVLSEAETQAARGGDGLLEDEWGNTSSVPLLTRMAAEADQRMVGWSYWAYEDCCLSPGAIVRDGAKPPTAAGNLNRPVLAALARPYPQAIAGTPTSWSYEPATRAFTLRYSTRRAGGGALGRGVGTHVELPALAYPTGYDATVSGARVRSAPDANVLRLSNDPGAATVIVRVVPARHHPAAPGPFAWPSGVTPVSADCPGSGRPLVSLPRRGGRVVRVAVYVDGRRAAT